MNSKSLKLLTVFFTAVFFIGSGLAAVTDFEIISDKTVNNESVITVSGSVNGSDKGNDVAFRINDSDGTASNEFNKGIGSGPDEGNGDSNFIFDINLSSKTYSGGDGRLSGDASIVVDNGLLVNEVEQIDGFSVENTKPVLKSIEATNFEDDLGNIVVNSRNDTIELRLEFSESMNASKNFVVETTGLDYSFDGSFVDAGNKTWEGDVSIDSGESADGVTIDVSGATDLYENQIDSNTSAGFTVDTDNPSIGVDNPSEGDVTQTQKYINGTAADGDSGLDKVSYQIIRQSDNQYYSGSGFQSSPANITLPGNSDWSDYVEGEFSGVTDEFDLIAYATDIHGNTVSSSEVSFQLDNDEPVVNGLDQPSADAFVSGIYDIQWDSGDQIFDQQSSVTIDLQYNYEENGFNDYLVQDLNNGGSYMWNTTEAEFNDGQYKLRITATDDAGNQNFFATENFRVDNSAPGFDSAITFDDDNDGHIEGVNVTYDEDVSKENLSAISVLGVSTSIQTATGVANDTVRYDFSKELEGTDVELKLNFSDGGAVEDLAGNPLPATGNQTVNDGASPVLMYATVDSSSSNSSSTVIKMKFSEEVQDAGDNVDVVLNDTSLDFVGSSASDSKKADYGEVLDTSRHPNVTGFDSVEDNVGNGAVLFQDSNVTVSTFRRELDEGWNFVSFPISSNAAPSITNFFDDNDVSKVWTYRDGEWIIYNDDKPSANLSYVYGGRGYLFDVENSFTMNPNVENVMNAGSTPKTPPSIGLDEGWNLVGHYQEFKQYDNGNKSGAFSSIWSSLGTVYGPRSDTGLNLRETSGIIQPGYAYWVSTRGDLSGGSVVYSEN